MKINSISSTSFGMMYKSSKNLPDDIKKKVVDLANKPKIFEYTNPVVKQLHSYFPDRKNNDMITITHKVINHDNYFLSGYQAIELEKMKNEYSGNWFNIEFQKEVNKLESTAPMTLLDIDYDKKSRKILSAKLKKSPND